MAGRPWRRLIFTPLEPARSPGEHEVRFIFDADGHLELSVNSDDVDQLAAQALPWFQCLAQCPGLFLEACGHRGAAVAWDEDSDRGEFR